MNPYSTPISDIETAGRKALRISTSVVIAILSVPAIYIIAFPVVGIIKDILAAAGVIGSFEFGIVLDAIITFIVLVAYFSILFNLRRQHARYICIFCGLSMFFYWGYESGFFWNGFSPMYPIWYEVNMAINDLVAALLVIFVNHRITNQASIRKKRETV